MKERHADDIRKDVELAAIEADKILADQVDVDLKIKVSQIHSGCTTRLWPQDLRSMYI